MKNRDVAMAKCFSKKYGNKGRAIKYMQSESYVKMPVNAWCYIPTSLTPEPWLIFYYLKLKSGNRYMPSPYYPASVMLFTASWGYGQSYASISHTLLNCA